MRSSCFYESFAGHIIFKPATAQRSSINIALIHDISDPRKAPAAWQKTPDSRMPSALVDNMYYLLNVVVLLFIPEARGEAGTDTGRRSLFSLVSIELEFAEFS